MGALLEAIRRWARAHPRTVVVVLVLVGASTVLDAGARILALYGGGHDGLAVGAGVAAGLVGVASWRAPAPRRKPLRLRVVLFVAAIAALPPPFGDLWLPEPVQLFSNSLLLAFVLGVIPVVHERMQAAERAQGDAKGFAARATDALLDPARAD